MEIVHVAISASLAVLISYAIPAIVDYFRYKINKNVTGEWFSSWQPKNDSSGCWVSEELKISPRLGSLKFINRNNNMDYNWEGRCKLKYGKHIIGEWHSLKPGSNSKGTFMLTLSPQGNFMFGEIVGPNDNDSIKSSPFVIARSINDLEKAKEFVNK